MDNVSSMVTLAARDYDAVLFDLDGVLTRTADIHAAAWKRLFDEFLQQRASRLGEPFVPFDMDDYRLHVDGKPRNDGVASFLASRGIGLPAGSAGDAPGNGTIQGLGRLKDEYFSRELEQHGARVYEASIALVHELRAQEIRTAVVSSSRNCAAVLQAAGIDHLFDERVDGQDIISLELSGKPAADTFLEAARRLGVEPFRAVVVEDAIAGVQAGRAGAFGLVIGVDRGANRQALLDAGADVVVDDLVQVRAVGEPASTWSLVYEGFERDQEGIRESLCALGNGYFTTRGALPWVVADEYHYPGTYLAGGYNRLRTDIEGRTVENEDLVNLPNWLALQFRIAGQGWFSLDGVKILSYRQELDLRRGMLLRDIRFEDAGGRVSSLREQRLVSMHNMHLAATQITLTAENWSDRVTVRSGIDGRIINTGAELYRKFNSRHLEPAATFEIDDCSVGLQVRMCQSHIGIAQAARTRLSREGARLDVERSTIEEPGYIAQEMTFGLEAGQSVTIEKIISFHSSRDPAISECGLAARRTLEWAQGFDALMAEHVLAWKHLWRRFDIHLSPTGDDSEMNLLMLLRLNMFHLLQTISPQSIGLDIGVPSRGWTGEAYQGHIFWDELFIFPFFNLRVPQITRSLLMYRVRRLDAARAAARRAGYQGAMFPWQSSSDGREETQEANLNPRSQRWVPDNSYLQRHVGSAIVYNVWQYFQVTNDLEFMQSYGAELVLDIARFWSSIATFNEARGRYDIRGVMGPDEFHDAYPDSDKPGLDNNAYTNIMAVWVFCRALDTLELLSATERNEIMSRLGLTATEIARWQDITHRMFVPFHDDMISQFEGYEKLRELDWDAYRARYGNIQRLDLILEAEDDSANCYRASKQPDVLMLFYLFSPEELQELFERLGYAWDDGLIARNVDYYSVRSSHGSTLSRVVHAWVLARSDRSRAMHFFAEALQSDVKDIQQGSTAEGIHLGAMAGSVDIVERASTGIETEGNVLRLNPSLPPELDRLDMRIHYRGHSLDLRLTRESLTVHGHNKKAMPIQVSVQGMTHEFHSGTTHVFPVSGVSEDSPVTT